MERLLRGKSRRGQIMCSQVLFVVVLLSRYVFGCEDISPSACQKFVTQNPDMCSHDECYSFLCPWTCNKCAALTCYSCGSVSRPEDCQASIECPTKDHKCISAKSYTANFQEVYSLGCAFRSVCDADTDTFCCSSDLCNNNSTQQQTTSTALSGNSCRDIHTSGCQDLLAANSSICQNSCVKSLCPFSCGTCKLCYACDHVPHSEQCTSTTVCQQGEYCYGVERFNSKQEHGFRLGCAPNLLCQQISSIAVNTFGRRRSLAGGCCNGQLCNNHLKAVTTTTIPKTNFTTTTTTKPTTTSTTTTTTKPTTTSTTTTTTAKPTTTSPTTKHRTTNGPSACHCSGTLHYHHNHECYFISETKGTRQEGKAYCSSRCGHLATFDSSSAVGNVMEYFYNRLHKPVDGHMIGFHVYDQMWVDAMKVHLSLTHPKYIWESTGQSVPDVLVNLHNHHILQQTYSDRCATTTSMRGHDIRGMGCNNRQFALCQLKKP